VADPPDPKKAGPCSPDSFLELAGALVGVHTPGREELRDRIAQALYETFTQAYYTGIRETLAFWERVRDNASDPADRAAVHLMITTTREHAGL
jgi:hypothetical protein